MQHVFIYRADGNIVFERGIAVRDQIHVHPEQRAALGHHQHVFGARGGDDLLALFTARLVVILHAHPALRLDPADMGERILVIVDPGEEARRLRAVDDLSGRENPRGEQAARLLTLGGGEDRARLGGRIMGRGGAERELLDLNPILLRDQIALPLRPVGMRIDQAGDDRLARHVDCGRTARDCDRTGRADRNNAIALDQHGPVRDFARAALSRHGEDGRPDQRDRALGLVCGDGHRQRNPGFGRGELILRARRVGEQIRQRDAVEGRAVRPGDHPAIGAPADIISASLRDLGRRQGAAAFAYSDRLPAGHERHHEDFVILDIGDKFTARRDAESARQIALRMHPFGFAIEVGRDELEVPAARSEREQPVLIRPEMRVRKPARDQFGRAAANTDAVGARIFGIFGIGQEAALVLLEHNAVTIRRKAGARIMSRHAGDLARIAAAGIGDDDFAQASIGPADIGHPLTIARESRPAFDRVVVARQPPGRTAVDGFGPQFAEAFEHHAAPIGRQDGVLDHPGRDRVGRDRDHRMRCVRDAARIVDPEGDFARAAAIGVHAAQFAARPEHNRPAVGHPVHVRIDAVNRPGALQVEIEFAVDFPLAAGNHILDEQLGLVALAPHERHQPPIGRGSRTHRPAITGNGRARFAGGKIVTLDLEQRLGRVLRIFEDRPGSDVPGVIDRLAIGGIDRLAQFLLVLLVGPLDQSDAAAARDVVEPDFAGARAAPGGEVLLGDDEAAVGRPVGLVQQAEAFLGQLLPVRAIGIHQPDIVAPAAIRGESDAAAIGRPARLHFPGEPLGNPGRGPAGNRHGVDIAEHGEGQHPPVGRDIDIHPRALIGADRDLLDIEAGRVGDVPFGVLVAFRRFDRGRLDRFAAIERGQFVRFGLRRDHLVFRLFGFLDRHLRVLPVLRESRLGGEYEGEGGCDATGADWGKIHETLRVIARWRSKARARCTYLFDGKHAPAIYGRQRWPLPAS